MTSRTDSNDRLPSSHRELLNSDPSPWKREEGWDQGFVDGEGEAFVETSTDFDHQRAAVGEDGSRDVTTGEPPAEGIRLAVDLDRSLCIDSPNERDPAPGQGKTEAAAAIPIRRQGEGGREGSEVGSVMREPPAWITGAGL